MSASADYGIGAHQRAILALASTSVAVAIAMVDGPEEVVEHEMLNHSYEAGMTAKQLIIARWQVAQRAMAEVLEKL